MRKDSRRGRGRWRTPKDEGNQDEGATGITLKIHENEDLDLDRPMSVEVR
jgi:hypothetical protein